MKTLRVSRTVQILLALAVAAAGVVGVSLSVQAAQSAPVPAELLADYDTSPG
jgi:hypothetical protein